MERHHRAFSSQVIQILCCHEPYFLLVAATIAAVVNFKNKLARKRREEPVKTKVTMERKLFRHIQAFAMLGRNIGTSKNERKYNYEKIHWR